MTASTCRMKLRARYAWLRRGTLGFTLLAVAIVGREPILAIPALLGALIAFRGCPMCWVFGLTQHESQKVAPAARKEVS